MHVCKADQIDYFAYTCVHNKGKDIDSVLLNEHRAYMQSSMLISKLPAPHNIIFSLCR